jgi:outer membrane protein
MKATLSLILNIVLIIAVAALYYIHFHSSGYKSNIKGNNGSSVNSNIVFVNTDTIWKNYKFVEDKKKELADYEQNLQSQYESKAKAFEKEYKDYLKEGTSGKLTLAQQKKREQELGKEQQSLAEYDKKLSSQFMELQQKLNNLIQDSIVGFVRKHNLKNNYTYVLGYSRNSGILFADDKNDITKDILDGLNNEYNERKK